MRAVGIEQRIRRHQRPAGRPLDGPIQGVWKFLQRGRDFDDIKAYSAIFFGLKPGDEVTLGYERDGKKGTIKATLLSKNRSDE